MGSKIEALADFAGGTPAESIPASVIEYTKLVLCDTIISGLCTMGLARGDMARRLAETMGGDPEALVLGSSRRASVFSAAYANADLMNLMDADETFFNGAHFAAMSFAPALAGAEHLRRSGLELLRAAAISFDVNARLNLGTSLMEYDGERFRFSQLSSHGYAALGAAVAMSLLSEHDADRIADAMGLATWLAPTAKNGYMSRRRRFNSLKYGANGQIAHAGVTASAMAGLGYEGDRDGLDIEPGFLDGQGYRGGNRNAITERLGEIWWITETSVKPYPSCRYSHAAIDALRRLRRDTGLRPEEITEIEVQLSPAAYSISQFREPLRDIPEDHISPYAVQFNMPTLAALALLDVPPGAGWHRPETYDAPEVRALAAKVVTAPDPVLAEEWHKTITADGEKVRRTRGAIRITTEAGTRLIESEFASGDPWADDTRVSWAMVEEKLRTFAEGMLDADQQSALLDRFRRLDEVDDIATELIPVLMPVQSSVRNAAA